MTRHSAGAGAGCLPRSTSLNSFRRISSMFRREVASTPLNCTHCSSIVVRRLRLCSVPFLPCLLSYLFLEQVPQTRARLVQFGLRFPPRPSMVARVLVCPHPCHPRKP